MELIRLIVGMPVPIIIAVLLMAFSGQEKAEAVACSTTALIGTVAACFIPHGKDTILNMIYVGVVGYVVAYIVVWLGVHSYKTELDKYAKREANAGKNAYR